MTVPRHHKEHAPASVVVGIITISDTRVADTDDSGRVIRELLLRDRHELGYTAIVKDEAAAILDAVTRAAEGCDAIVTNGGTGLGRRDVTIPTLAPHLGRVLPGFGEVFRSLSYAEIGSPAILSGAIAGVFRGRLVFCLPGSPDACRLAMEKLILPELGHAVGLLRR
ncbi:MAG TPA: molybdenum cofactor biosynthesis protein B [Thermoplasmata archaeon]|nr:molybdenum cofactor biosynthesis protein B [Thermoplasmata archaeon]